MRDVIPGRGLALGMTTAILTLVVLLPLAALALTTWGLSPGQWWHAIAAQRTLAAFRLTIGCSLVAAALDGVLGLLIAWVLVRTRFTGRPFVDAIVDVPFAIPSPVIGIALVAVYSAHGLIGSFLEAHGIKVAFTPLGIVLALTTVGLPFVVRAVQPVLSALSPDYEEAAAILGASPFVTFRRVIFPLIVPALLTGFALALGRAIGEYGSVVFIAGNMPARTEIVPLVILTHLEEYDNQGAAAIAITMLAISFALLTAINAWQRRLTLRRTAI